MRILIDLIDYPQAGGREYDWRYKIWVTIGKELEHRGHHVFGSPQRHGTKNPFRHPSEKVDYYICHSPYGHDKRSKLRKKLRKSGVPVSVCDHGWLPKSVVVDKEKLFGDSYYYNTIKETVKRCPEDNDFRQKLLQQNYSKRPQYRTDTIPKVKYIFVPGQVLFDASIVYYSKTGLRELLSIVTDYASLKGLHVVYKPHPGMLGLAAHGKKLLDDFCKKLKKEYNNFHIVNTSIYDLMQGAEFTACVNSGSIIDNIVTQTPAYCCGQSFFSQSRTVIYNPNITKGLMTMTERAYDWEEMKKQQARMLWWLRENMIQEHLPVEENILRLETHSGVQL